MINQVTNGNHSIRSYTLACLAIHIRCRELLPNEGNYTLRTITWQMRDNGQCNDIFFIPTKKLTLKTEGTSGQLKCGTILFA